jgi:hypothetical protein
MVTKNTRYMMRDSWVIRKEVMLKIIFRDKKALENILELNRHLIYRPFITFSAHFLGPVKLLEATKNMVRTICFQGIHW